MFLEENENRNCGCSCGRNCNSACPMTSNENMMTDNGFQNPMAMPAAINLNASACNCCCQQNPTPSIPTYSFNFTHIMPEETCPKEEMTRAEMLEKIRCLGFSVVELAEYLDTHPEDEKALCLHREYATKLRELADKYQKVFGPLTIYFPCNSWRWLEEPWPWERGSF